MISLGIADAARQLPRQRAVLDTAPLNGITLNNEFTADTLEAALDRAAGRYSHALRHPTVYRVVTLISTIMGELVAGGGLYVQNRRDHERVDNRRTRDLCDLIQNCPDGELSGLDLWQDVSMDYLLSGNGLAHVVRGAMGQAIAIKRIDTETASVDRTTAAARVYRFSYPQDPQGAETAVGADVIHARFPLVGGASDSAEMAPSPLRLLSTTVDIAREADQYVLTYFTQSGAIKSQMVLTCKEDMTPDQKIQLQDTIKRYASDKTGRLPAVFNGDFQVTSLKQTPQDADARELREQQSIQIGSIYGVPAPLLGLQVTEWGQGIEQLRRLFHQFGVRQHLARLLHDMSRVLLPKAELFRIDDSEWMRGDHAAVAGLITAAAGDAVRPAILTQSELRRLVGFPKSPPKGEALRTPKPPSEAPPAPVPERGTISDDDKEQPAGDVD